MERTSELKLTGEEVKACAEPRENLLQADGPPSPKSSLNSQFSPHEGGR